MAKAKTTTTAVVDAVLDATPEPKPEPVGREDLDGISKAMLEQWRGELPCVEGDSPSVALLRECREVLRRIIDGGLLVQGAHQVREVLYDLIPRVHSELVRKELNPSC